MKKTIAVLLIFSLVSGLLYGCGHGTSIGKEQEETEENPVAENAYYIIKEIKCFNADGTMGDRVNVEFNDQGFPQRVKRIKENVGEVSYEFEYDAQNCIVAYEMDDWCGSSRIEYNEYGDFVRQINLNSGTESGRTEYKYDEMGRCMEELEYSLVRKEEVDRRTTYKYDEAGRVVCSASTTYANDGPPGAGTSTANYEYNDNGYIESEEGTTTSNYADNETSWSRQYEYIYDSDGNVLEQREHQDWGYSQYDRTIKWTFRDGKPISKEDGDDRQEYEYDQNGNVIEIRQYYQGELNRRYEYSYSEKPLELTDAQKKVYSELKMNLGNGDECFTTIINYMEQWDRYPGYVMCNGISSNLLLW